MSHDNIRRLAATNAALRKVQDNLPKVDSDLLEAIANAKKFAPAPHMTTLSGVQALMEIFSETRTLQNAMTNTQKILEYIYEPLKDGKLLVENSMLQY